jgi:hypothetical protein
MPDELTRKIMANLFPLQGEPSQGGPLQGEEKNTSRSLDPGEEALLVERIHAATKDSGHSAAPRPREGKTMSLKDLAEQKISIRR